MSSNISIESEVLNDESRLNIDELENILEQKLIRDEQDRFFESRLMRAYLHYGSYRKLSIAADIPYRTIQNTLQPYMKQLRESLNDEYYG